MEQYLAGGEGEFYRGEVKRNKETLALFTADEELQEAVAKWMARGKYEKLLELWVKGLAFDWERLYVDTKPQRISLPTYPFARERYWVPETPAVAAVAAKTMLHPLLQENTSTLSQQRFTSTFTGEEFFLSDHVIKGERVLPGVAYLEMARAAAVQASDVETGSVRLENVVWARPVSVNGEPAEVRIGLYPEPTGAIEYTIYTGSDQMHSQGRALIRPVGDPPTMDVEALLASCQQSTLSAEQCYTLFDQAGLAYGPAHRGLKRVHVGSGQALAELALPESLQATAAQYEMHPSIMDASLQAMVALLADEKQTLLPFAVEGVSVYRPTPAQGWAWVRKSANGHFDIDVLDRDGRVCVSLERVAVRAVGPNPQGDQNRAWTVVPVWDAVRVEAGAAYPMGDRMVVVGGQETPESLGTIDHLVWIAPEMEPEALVLLCFRWIQAVLAAGNGRRAMGWTVITRPGQAGIHGLIGSMAKEYPNWKVRLVEWDVEVPLEEVFALAPDQGNVWRRRGGQWQRQRLIACELPEAHESVYRMGGVYVIVGGAGGIGEALSEYLIRQYQAQVIWIGRRKLNAEIEGKQDRLGQWGPRPEYVRADASDRESLESGWKEIRERHGQVHGVIHSAIVLDDKSLAQMDQERFERVLAAKVASSVNLGEVVKGEDLDFVLFFSSMQSFWKAAGQSNYAAGCTFQDEYALGMKAKVVNWGYWGSVGVVSGEGYRRRMEQAGIGSIEPVEAMEVLEKLLASPLPQVGYVRAVKGTLGLNAEERMWQVSGVPAVDADQVRVPELEVEPAWPFEELLKKLLWTQLRAVGLLEPGTWNAGLPEWYRRWLEESRRMAQPGENAWAEWESRKSAWLEDEQLRARVALLEVALRGLPDILTGRRAATSILFPNSSLELVEGIYKNNRTADYYNDVVAEMVAGYVDQRRRQDASVKLRLVEIGAGTGGTTARVLEKLRGYEPWIGEYCYTDISKAFLLHAERTYGRDYPYLTYRLWNVEEAQGIEAGTFDIAIAANVLHATRDIRNTVRNAKAGLKRNGWLVLNEITGRNVFTHLTFGLLEGWWLYEDAGLREAGSPALSGEGWRRVLGEEGFGPVWLPTESASRYGQRIVVAQSDGFVRQAERKAAPVIPAVRAVSAVLQRLSPG